MIHLVMMHFVLGDILKTCHKKNRNDITKADNAPMQSEHSLNKKNVLITPLYGVQSISRTSLAPYLKQIFKQLCKGEVFDTENRFENII